MSWHRQLTQRAAVKVSASSTTSLAALSMLFHMLAHQSCLRTTKQWDRSDHKNNHRSGRSVDEFQSTTSESTTAAEHRARDPLTTGLVKSRWHCFPPQSWPISCQDAGADQFRGKAVKQARRPLIGSRLTQILPLVVTKT